MKFCRFFTVIKKVALDYLNSAVGLGAIDEKLFVARSRCLTSLERWLIVLIAFIISIFIVFIIIMLIQAS